MSTAPPKTVLIADDDPTNRELVEAFLVKSGYRVIIAHHGEEAVQHANDQPLHAILLDISMPILDGKQAATLIREVSVHNRTTPIAALTAYEISLDDPTMAGGTINAVFRKPVEWSKLIDWINDIGHTDQEPPDAGTNTMAETDLSAVDINQAIIDQMRHSLPPETVMRLFSRFQEDLNRRLSELDDAIARKDIEQIRKTTHALCGIASAFGAISLEQHARYLHNNADEIFAMIESGALDKLKTLATNTEATLTTLFHEPT
jgi:Response regulators consisting of a CheY-like receiver domain and a winged-helix DNA-binding domain